MNLLDHKLGQSTPPKHWLETFDRDAFRSRMQARRIQAAKRRAALLAGLILLVAATTASAGTLFILPNTAGGLIHLTDTPCSKNTYVVYTRTAKGNTSVGCWLVSAADEMVFVRWNDGEYSTYPTGAFGVTDYYKRQSQK